VLTILVALWLLLLCLAAAFVIGGLVEEARIERTPEVPAKTAGRHRVGEALGTQAQQHRWTRPTEAFAILVGATWSAQEREELRTGAAT
jgi:hypothetical protein